MATLTAPKGFRQATASVVVFAEMAAKTTNGK
jgi:hypothetical protein